MAYTRKRHRKRTTRPGTSAKKDRIRRVAERAEAKAAAAKEKK